MLQELVLLLFLHLQFAGLDLKILLLGLEVLQLVCEPLDFQAGGGADLPSRKSQGG